jgi:hypothetical protein
VVHSLIQPAPDATFPAPPPGMSRAPSVDPGALQTQLVALLEIPAALITRPKAVDLRLAYAKYQGYLKAQADMFVMIAEGTWTLKTLTGDELIEVFVSKSVWHANYRKLFPKVAKHAALLRWLQGGAGAPTNVEIFGAEKQTFNFRDLGKVLSVLEAVDAQPQKRGRSSLGEGGSGKNKKASGSSKRSHL